MRTTLSSSAWALALVLASCSEEPNDNSAGVNGQEEPGDDDTGTEPEDPPTPQCLELTPRGGRIFAQIVGATSFAATGDIAVDSTDHVVHALSRPPNVIDWGTTKLSNIGVTLYHRNFGELVAPDLSGNTYVAGLLTTATDFGTGRIVPHGDGHAYLVKLDNLGNTIFAREILPCGTEALSGLAVGNGRIAVSGRGMGTVILDAAGELLFRIDLFGDVAFDSQGNIVITGAVDSDMFIAKLDATGDLLFQIRIGDNTNTQTGTQVGTHVAIDADDNIVVAGTATNAGVNLFGEDWVSGTTQDGNTLALGFVIKLAPDGTLAWTHVFNVEANGGVAVDPLGNVVYSASNLGNVPPFLSPAIVKLAADDGRVLWNDAGPGIGYGTALGVGSDSCGNTFWATNVRVSLPEPDAPPAAYIMKLGL